MVSGERFERSRYMRTGAWIAPTPTHRQVRRGSASSRSSPWMRFAPSRSSLRSRSPPSNSKPSGTQPNSEQVRPETVPSAAPASGNDAWVEAGAESEMARAREPRGDRARCGRRVAQLGPRGCRLPRFRRRLRCARWCPGSGRQPLPDDLSPEPPRSSAAIREASHRRHDSDPLRTSAIACARPYGVPGASLVSWRGLPSGVARR
jgi:hypothetical protein